MRTCWRAFQDDSVQCSSIIQLVSAKLPLTSPLSINYKLVIKVNLADETDVVVFGDEPVVVRI